MTLKPVGLPYVRMPVSYCVAPEWWDMPPCGRFLISLLGLAARFFLICEWYALSLAVSGTRWAAFLVGLLIAAVLGFLWYLAPGKPGPVANDGLGLTAAGLSWIRQLVWRRQGMQAAEFEMQLYDCLSPWHIAIFVALLYASTVLVPALAPEAITMILKLIEALLLKEATVIVSAGCILLLHGAPRAGTPA